MHIVQFAECPQPECYYRGFRDDTGTFTPVHWKILALKFAFVIIFEHVVFGVCKLIDVIVPDIPESLDIKVKRERYLAKEALQDAEHVLQKVRTNLIFTIHLLHNRLKYVPGTDGP
jgi:anoctamin-7